eukprot:TRINITY_DN12902_c0_g1_i2.p1 TRINITY_DN12902_c0_g1~~TRINITY_DN12902_c0_g1_i2.p1  ORF type:complete len:265 (+),score=52.94 TRINITY_DN12902_c0_g1_i2:93-887(+)
MSDKKVTFPGDYLDQPLIGEGLTDASFGIPAMSPLGNVDYANERYDNEPDNPTPNTNEEEEEDVGKQEESSDDEVIIYDGKLPDTPPSELLMSTRRPRKSYFEAQRELAHHFTGEEKEIRLEVCILGASGLINKGSVSPVCEAKLRTVNRKTGVVGTSHPNPQKQQTAVASSLSPEWNKTFRFVLPSGDAIRMSFFGKRSFGTKVFLGRVDLTTEDMKAIMSLYPGGPAIHQSLPIHGDDSNSKRRSSTVSGTIDITLKIISLR